MTHAERMAALVAAGEMLSARENLEREDNNDTTRGRRILASLEFQKQAANARPTIALAAEGMKALKEWRECERKMNNVSNNTNDYQNAYNALGAAWRRIDKLLAQWEEGT